MKDRIRKKRLSRQLEYIFASIGYILYVTSLVEYLIVQIIAAEKYLQVFDKEDISYIDIAVAKENSNKTLHKLTEDSKMLGNLISILEKDTDVDRELISRLRQAAEIRGYYAHQFYKEDLYKKYLEREPLRYKKQINKDVGFVVLVHQELVELDEANRVVANKAKELGL